MKPVFIFSLFCLFISVNLDAQVRDSRFKGVSIWDDGGFSGTETKCTVEGSTYTFPTGIQSIKVYGAWKLVNTTTGLAILEDDSNYNGSGTGTWRLERTETKYFAIAYTEPNFNGQATFLKTGETDLHSPAASVKTRIQAAKLGWEGTTGYQKCVMGDYPTLSQDFARIDVSMAHMKCATIGSKVIGRN